MMQNKLNLRELKGAPLSIILAIMMAGNRTVSVSYLCTETGYSDKTISSGLDLLRGRQIVTETRRNHYQLTGGNVQLPLYWNERTEPADPSPASFQDELPGLRSPAGNFSEGNFQPGKFPKSGKIPENLAGEIPEMKARISALEAEVAALKSGIFPGSGEIPERNEKKSSILYENSPKIGEIPTETEEIPNDDIKSSTSINTNQYIKNHDDETEYREKFLDILSTLRNADMPGGMIQYKDPEIDQLISQHADLDLVEFVLPAASSFNAALKWLHYKDTKLAKIELCKIFGIYRKYRLIFSNREDITLHAIAYHYWKWRLTESDNDRITLGTVISRISNHFDQLKVESSWPLMCGYLD